MLNKKVTIYSLDYSFPDLEPVSCSMSGSNCCFLICIQISQEAGKVVWYSHLLKNFPQFVVIHTVMLVYKSLYGYEKNEASEGRVGAGRRVRKPSRWSRQEMIVAGTRLG